MFLRFASKRSFFNDAASRLMTFKHQEPEVQHCSLWLHRIHEGFLYFIEEHKAEDKQDEGEGSAVGKP